MSNKNWNEIRDGFIKQSKIALDFIDYCYINNIKIPECQTCSENEICYDWKLYEYTSKVIRVSVIFCSDGTITCGSEINGLYNYKNNNDKVCDFIYEGLNKYFKEN